MAPSNRIDEMIDTLTEGIKQLTTSADWQRWLTVQSRFHRYSFNNTLLIQLQRPGATRVAGFRAWQQLGRQVGKGEKAIWILAPVTRKADQADHQTDTTAPNPDRRRLVGVRPACVFDIAQTDGEDLPEVTARLTGDAPDGVYQQLVTVAQSIGYHVEDHHFPGSTNGDCTFTLKRIWIHDANASTQRTKTLARTGPRAPEPRPGTPGPRRAGSRVHRIRGLRPPGHHRRRLLLWIRGRLGR